MSTFRELYCAHHGIDETDFNHHVLRRCFRPLGRLLFEVRLLLPREFFAADRDFVSGVGQLTSMRDFQIEVMDFLQHPNHGRFMRRRLKVRVSIGRMQRLASAYFRDGAG